MNCPDFERWLDHDMPEAARADALQHANGCPVCADLLEAAVTVEAMLREEPRGEAGATRAPAGFTDAVLARIEGPDTAGAGERAKAATRREPWWIVWALDPASVVAITAAVVVAALARWHPSWFIDPAFAWIRRSAEWGAAPSADVMALVHATGPAWVAIGIGLAPLAIWGLVDFLRRLERLLLLFAAR